MNKKFYRKHTDHDQQQDHVKDAEKNERRRGLKRKIRPKVGFIRGNGCSKMSIGIDKTKPARPDPTK